jgi:hypothetical protein
MGRTIFIRPLGGETTSAHMHRPMVVTIMTVRVGELVGGMDSESVAGFLV